jgi:hypothetical protein
MESHDSTEQNDDILMACEWFQIRSTLARNTGKLYTYFGLGLGLSNILF